MTIKESLKQINKWEPHIGAFLEVFEDASSDKEGRLQGVPIAIKDEICTVEGHTTASSKILENFRSPFGATAVERLKNEGAVVIGKASCDEFAMGASNEYSAYGPVKNPWDVTRVPGGSSGGSAAAVASGEVPMALGTETGGSVRLPSSFCNVVGVKPTYGRVSRFGVIAYASSFDQVGQLAKTVKDAALLLEVMAGHDPRDATSSQEPVGNYVAACGQGIKNLTIGVPEEYFGEGVTPEVASVVKKAIAQLEKLGAKTVEISLPLLHAAVPTYYLLVKAEVSTNLGRFDGLRYGKLDLESTNLIEHYIEARGKYFGPEVKRSILMGTYALSAGYVDAWYKQASRVRTLIRREFENAFKEVDLIAAPVSPEVPFKIGEKADDPLAMYLADSLVAPMNIAGIPAISVPAGFSNGLPVGLQLIAPHFKEETMFQVAHAYEQSQDWYKQTPDLPK